MAVQYFCQNLFRRQAVAGQPKLNGIDYLEVGPDQTTLTLFFIHDLAAFPSLSHDNVIISGGARIKGAILESALVPGELRVVAVSAAGRQLTVTVNTPGDFSTYTLRLIQSPANLRPPTGFDPHLAAVNFSFKVDCPSDFDCATAQDCPPDPLPEPEISYLAKDYASFRQLLLDRLSVMMPDWTERNPADLMVALVELLAYAGDHLSYYQ
ncbi:MAG TPA: putative baseplate assembly protein, partial [Anaerolineae bacterium]|nr:putative baseplate assembly protein [Anaerolineae bacterium]